MSRYLAVAVVSAYLGAGLFAGLIMQRAIPAITPIGVAWVAATWPNQIRCARVVSGCNPLPPEWLKPYAYSFQENHT